MVENLCCHKMSAQLYTQLRVVCENHVSSCVDQFVSYPPLLIHHTAAAAADDEMHCYPDIEKEIC